MDKQLEAKLDCELEVSLVGDEELLYRRILACSSGTNEYYTKSSEGKVNFSRLAFADRGLKPSVDRACLHENDPTKTQLFDTDGVIGLIAGNVRAIDDLSSGDAKGNVTALYKIDVIHRPKLENKAHARIEPSPEYSNDKVFKRLQQRLARLADEYLLAHGWEIKPDGLD
ncbi:hypothetical protein [Pseudanabaena biceps]|uniref:hypothetical protein n=1 Tax=Pseudanabaena biceps TaxID=927669 RepID=UPI00068C63DE|nr:hypothetical protein [Pseudanabaena biceps]